MRQLPAPPLTGPWVTARRGGARRFHARKFLERCGWRVKPDFERRYPTRAKQADKLAELSADVLDTDEKFRLWRWLLRKLT